MKKNKLVMLLVCALMFLLSTQTTLADDVFVPSWRGTYGTVVAGCTGWTKEDSNGNGTAVVWIGKQTNPGGPNFTLPLAPARYSNGHQMSTEERQSVIEIEPGGEISFSLPNYEGGFQKIILLQMTCMWSPVGGIKIWSSEVSLDPNDFPPAYQPAVNARIVPNLCNVKTHKDGWTTYQTGWIVEPNPSHEGFTISFDESDWIDQIVVDTICFSVPDDTKWEQLPDESTEGIDIRVDRNDQYDRIVADDFLCTITEPITDIRLWGSWKDDVQGIINKINLSIYSDTPATPTSHSKPADELWSMDITNFTETLHLDLDPNSEWWWDTYAGSPDSDGDQQIWQYDINIDPNVAFFQRGTFNEPLVYWLGVYAETDGTGEFGWKTRDWNDGHFNDSAVYLNNSNWVKLEYPPEHPYDDDSFPYVDYSIDMAFALKTVTEPHMDLGDAPDSSHSYDPNTMTAYPGVKADFPTVYRIGSPPYGPIHRWPKSAAYLGSDVSYEFEADILADEDGINNIIPSTDTSDLDNFDDGVSPLPDLPYCRWTTFDYDVTVVVPGNNLYVNVWFDWTRDGDWDDTPTCSCCTPGPAPEWAVKNQLLYNLPAGNNTVKSSAFRTWHPNPDEPEDIWMRISLSEQPWAFEDNAIDPNGVAGSGPAGGYLYGETEDYLYTPVTSCTECGNLNCDSIVNIEDLAIFARQWLLKCD